MIDETWTWARPYVVGRKTYRIRSLNQNTGKIAPSITFENITFSDGTTIPLTPIDIVVFVGPNNVGKSAALRDLERCLISDPERKVITKASLFKTGSTEELIDYLGEHSQVSLVRGERLFSGFGYAVHESNVSHYWENDLRDLSQLFCAQMFTENRINGSNPVPAIDVVDEVPQEPIQLLYTIPGLEERISEYFERAFGEELIVDRGAGRVFPLLIGERLPPDEGEDGSSPSYCGRLRDATEPLQDQGDGMRSFANVLLRLLAPITQSVLLFDEPEAFLHPPQARLMGRLIATEKRSCSQLFVATHSPDVLEGLIEVAPDNLHVLRIQRDGKINSVTSLDKRAIKGMNSDALTKYSSVISGVFHKRVIICEGDSDCMFYSAILDVENVRGELHPDVLFVHGGGKDRVDRLAKAMKDLDVAVDVIVDIDVLQDPAEFRKIYGSLGGDFRDVEPLVNSVKSAIETRVTDFARVNVATEKINEALKALPTKGRINGRFATSIREIVRGTSPWDYAKQGGVSTIPRGGARADLEKLLLKCKEIGLWIVPVGEMESFCGSVGSKSGRWVRKVLESRDLASDTELGQARDFMKDIWLSKA